MKILNLYACLGGNRYKWDDVAEQAGIDIEVTALGIIRKKDQKQISIFDSL
jgi:hypothetical protein